MPQSYWEYFKEVNFTRITFYRDKMTDNLGIKLGENLQGSRARDVSYALNTTCTQETRGLLRTTYPDIEWKFDFAAFALPNNIGPVGAQNL